MASRGVQGIEFLRKEYLQYELKIRALSEEGTVAHMRQHLRGALEKPVVINKESVGEMSALLLLVLPLLAGCAFSNEVYWDQPREGGWGPSDEGGWGPSHEGGWHCELPPASTEEFDASPVGQTWYLQYQYRVPGLSDLGCITQVLSFGHSHNELYLRGNFSRVPLYPLEANVNFHGNRYIKNYHGVWDCLLSAPCNMVYLHKDFYINHFCFLGYEVSQIYTSVMKPGDWLLKHIWKVVDSHPEVDRSKYKKVVC